MPVHSANNLVFKNFVIIALFCIVSEVNGRITIFGGNDFTEIAQSRTVSEITTFLHFIQTFKMAIKKWRQNDFGENLFLRYLRFFIVKKIVVFKFIINKIFHC